jgi:hypothetical protein
MALKHDLKHPAYVNMVICEETLATLPRDEIPDCLWNTVVHAPASGKPERAGLAGLSDDENDGEPIPLPSDNDDGQDAGPEAPLLPSHLAPASDSDDDEERKSDQQSLAPVMSYSGVLDVGSNDLNSKIRELHAAKASGIPTLVVPCAAQCHNNDAALNGDEMALR